jgi:hypothetical protein
MTACRNLYRKRGTGTIRKGYLVVGKSGKQAAVHKAIVERILGKPLPPGAVVHHMDNNPLNNANGNLVVCPSQAYHALLHRRRRAYDACGRADWRRCANCKEYDDPANMTPNMRRGAVAMYRHPTCQYVHIRSALGD